MPAGPVTRRAARLEQRFHERGRPGEQLRAELRSRGHKRRLEELADDPIRKLALKLTAARGGTRIPASPQSRAPRRVAGSCRCRHSLNDDKTPTAAPRRLGQRLKCRDLGLAFQEQDSARRKHTRRRHHDQSVEGSAPDSLEVRLGLPPTRVGPVSVQSLRHGRVFAPRRKRRHDARPGRGSARVRGRGAGTVRLATSS